MTPPSPDKARLLAELQASRLALSRDASTLVNELNFVKKIEQTVRRKPFAWLGGAALAGFTLSALRRRPVPPPSRKNRSSAKEPTPSAPAVFSLWAFLFGLIKLLLPTARPLLTAYATKRMADLASQLGRK